MYFVFKYLLVVILSSLFLLLNSTSLIRVLVILENTWVTLFSFLCFLDIYIDDVIFLNMALVSLVLAACEVVTLISLYIIDYNK